jgi:hypothetical protein
MGASALQIAALSWLAFLVVAPADAAPAARPYVIHAIAPPAGVLTAHLGEPLLVQPATTPSGARLEEPTHSYGRIFVGSRPVPAGALLFSAPWKDQTLFCQSAREGGFGDLIDCYGDSLNAGDFDQIYSCSSPFGGVPIFTNACTPPSPLQPTVRYTHLAEPPVGPSVDFVLTYRLKRNESHARGAFDAIAVLPGFRVGGRIIGLETPVDWRTLADGQTATISSAGATIQILAVNEDGGVRYLVVAAMPTHEATVELGPY